MPCVPWCILWLWPGNPGSFADSEVACYIAAVRGAEFASARDVLSALSHAASEVCSPCVQTRSRAWLYDPPRSAGEPRTCLGISPALSYAHFTSKFKCRRYFFPTPCRLSAGSQNVGQGAGQRPITYYQRFQTLSIPSNIHRLRHTLFSDTFVI